MRKYLLLIFYIFSSETILNAQTNVGGLISTNTVWSKTGSPYIVGSRVVVSNNAILTIEPGCEIRFKENTQIFINTKSRLVSNGTSSDTIIFKMDTPGDIIKMPAGYYSSLIYDYDSISLNYCSFDGFNMQGNNNYPSIVFTWGSISFTNCIFSNNIVDGYLAVGRTEAQNCNFLNNKVSMGILEAYLVKSCNFFENYGKWIVVGNSTQVYTFTGNYFVRNHSSSINFHSSNLGGSMNYNTFSSNQFIPYGGGDDSVLIHSKSSGHYNNFVNNDFPYLLASNIQTSSIDWSNNYWQEISSNKIEKYLWKDPNLLQTFITFQPFLTEPDTVAPPMPPMGVTIVNKTLNGFTVKWKKSVLEDLKGYKIYYEDSSSVYPRSQSIKIGKDTSYMFNNLSIGKQYYVSVTAYDLGENESWYSEEIIGQTQLPLTRHVPSVYSTIQAALNAAQSGDTVLVQPGTYKENLVWPNVSSIKLIGIENQSKPIIDGNLLSTVIYLSGSSIDTTTEISNFNIKNGKSQNGGGLYIYKCSIKLSNIVVDNCNAKLYGGGIYAENSNSIFYKIKILNSSTDVGSNGNGGGLYLSTCNGPKLNNIILSNNLSYVGGGLAIYMGSINADSVSIFNNQSSGSAGINIMDGNHQLKNFYINNNNTIGTGGEGGGGGTISNVFGILSNFNIYMNKSNNNGGGLILNGNSAQLNNFRIVENECGINGGGIYSYGNITMNNSVIINNTSGLSGSGMYIYGNFNVNMKSMDIINNTVKNSSGNKSSIYIYPYTSNSTLLINNSNIVNNGFGIYNSGMQFITASNNYWGTSSGPYHPNQNASGTGDSVNAFVNVTPWLTSPDTVAPPIPAQNVRIISSGKDFISLGWDSSLLGDLKGYKVFYKMDSSGYPYSNSIDVGNVTNIKLSGLTTNKKYFIAVVVYDLGGNESWYSNEISATTVPPLISVGSLLVFENTITNDSSFKTLNIISQSSSPLTISALNNSLSIFQKNASLPIVINGGDTLKLKIAFKPAQFGTTIDTLKITSDGGNADIVLSGTSPYPVLVSNTSSLSYGAVARNNSKPLTIKIFNTSINTLTVDSIYTKTTSFTVDKTSGSIGTDTLLLNVTFSPIVTGSFLDTLYLRNNSTTTLVKIPLSGSTPVPVLAVSDTVMQFADKAKGDSVSKVFTIINKSISPMTVSSISVGTNVFVVDTATVQSTAAVTMGRRIKGTSTISDGESYSILNNIGGVLPEFSLPATVKDSLKVRVWFKPNGFGQYTDTLSIVSDGGSKKIPLSGSSPLPVLTSNQSNIDWLLVSKGKVQTKELRLRNESINTLAIDSVYTKTKQFVANKNVGSVVMNETLSVMVDFTADTFAVYTDTLYLRNNSVNGLVKIPLKGESPVPVFTLTPNVYRKDSVAIGDSSLQIYTIKNTSINDLTYDSAITKTLPFIIKGATTGSIKSNDSSVITLLFKPTAYGEFVDTLTVSSLGKITKLPLTGSSPYPKMVMSLSSLDFGNVRKDTVSKKTIIVKNTSINKLRIDSLKTKSTQFTVDKLASPIFVTKKDSAIFFVTFKADTIKKYNDTLSIYSNQQTPIVLAALTGSGTLTSVLFSDNLMPTVYELNQNFPNPFNPSTTLRYGLPHNSTVSLKIYNVLGQQVASLANGEQSMGWHYATWNANVSTGLYFYRLEAVDVANPNNRFVQVKKMMLLK